MAQIICEVCGSTDLMKQDGAFVCQGCGMKYSLEEVRKMLGAGGTPAVGVSLTNTQKQTIENYLSMCKNAHEASDTQSVVEYADKILEMDPNHYEAWRYRALSSGWNSSLNNLKTGQVVTAAKKALELAPDDKKTSLQKKSIYRESVRSLHT